ncbi:MAG TPA: CoA transferase, partial [Dehalococcoidia bacterium]|nr:CoA transferase [Dehalococcoidia bacterium]
MSEADTGALEGVRILDLADERAAHGVKLLADFGADVIKVEPPGGDRTRSFAPFIEGASGPESSLFFAYYQTNRRSIVLDLDTAEDRDVMLRLADEADIIVETLPTGRLAALGLGYEALAARNPRLIVTSVTPFGQSGPRAHWQGGDLVAWASSGVMGVMGSPDREPLRGFNSQGNHWVGAWAAIGTLGALRHQRRTGLGQHIDLSMQEALALQAESSNLLWQYEDRRTVRQGNGHILAVPFGCFRCSDGWAVLLAISQGQWKTLLDWMLEDGHGRELTGPGLETHHGRTANQAGIKSAVGAWAARYTVEEIVREGQRRRLPFASAARLDQVVADQQLAARGYFRPLDVSPVPPSHSGGSAAPSVSREPTSTTGRTGVHASADPTGGRTVLFPGAPFPLAKGAWAIRRPAPRLDQHGAAIRAHGWAEPAGESSGCRVPDSEFRASRAEDRGPRVGGEASGSEVRGTSSGGRGPQAGVGLPLAGVRVADFTWALAGPWATRALAD